VGSVIPQIAATVENVFSPKLSKGDKVFKDYFLITLFIGFGLLMASFLSPWLILPFGPKYAQSATILAIFFIGFIPLFLSGSFAASILYHYGKSQWHFYVNLFSLIFSTVFYFILTPKFGGHGAAIVIACSNFLSFVLYYLLWRYQTKKLAIN
jgi:O-antigen/teichoic acid export membrane protein